MHGVLEKKPTRNTLLNDKREFYFDYDEYVNIVYIYIKMIYIIYLHSENNNLTKIVDET